MAVANLTEHEAYSLLNDLRQGLNADGYDLVVAGLADKLELRVVATEAACEDCLVPKDIMSAIFASALQQGGKQITAEDILLEYPAEH